MILSETMIWVIVIATVISVGFGGIIFGAAAYPTYTQNGIITHVTTYQGDNSPRQIITVETISGLVNVTSTCDFYKAGQSVQIEYFPKGHWWIWELPGAPNSPPILNNPYVGC